MRPPWGPLCCLLLAVPAAAQQRPDPGQTRALAEWIAQRDDVQQELPSSPDAPPADPDTGPGGSGRPRRGDRPIGEPSRGEPRGAGGESYGGSGSSGVAEAFAWCIVGAVAVMLAVALVRAFAERRRDAAARAARRATAAPVAAAVKPPLADFERLAAEGRFAEAVHALLLHAFVRLAERRGTGWPRAQTGREILAAVGGFRAGDAPLQLVFTTAEAAWFGRAGVDRQRWDECLRGFRSWSAS